MEGCISSLIFEWFQTDQFYDSDVLREMIYAALNKHPSLSMRDSIRYHMYEHYPPSAGTAGGKMVDLCTELGPPRPVRVIPCCFNHSIKLEGGVLYGNPRDYEKIKRRIISVSASMTTRHISDLLDQGWTIDDPNVLATLFYHSGAPYFLNVFIACMKSLRSLLRGHHFMTKEVVLLCIRYNRYLEFKQYFDGLPQIQDNADALIHAIQHCPESVPKLYKHFPTKDTRRLLDAMLTYDREELVLTFLKMIPARKCTIAHCSFNFHPKYVYILCNHGVKFIEQFPPLYNVSKRSTELFRALHHYGLLDPKDLFADPNDVPAPTEANIEWLRNRVDRKHLDRMYQSMEVVDFGFLKYYKPKDEDRIFTSIWYEDRMDRMEQYFEYRFGTKYPPREEVERLFIYKSLSKISKRMVLRYDPMIVLPDVDDPWYRTVYWLWLTSKKYPVAWKLPMEIIDKITGWRKG